MKTSLIAIMLLIVALVFSSGCATSHSHSTAWEYKVLPNPPFEKRESAFNELGKDRWVLVGADARDVFYFKRAKR
jgi:hypothetical protein